MRVIFDSNRNIIMVLLGVIMGRNRNKYWDVHSRREQAIHSLVKATGKPLRKITKRDFIERDLGPLLNLYNGSPKRALKDAGYDPGPMKHERGHWESQENRIKAVMDVMDRCGKSSLQLRKVDFITHGYSLLVKNRSIRDLLLEAELDYEQYQRESGYWRIKENRITEVRELVERLGKDPSQVTKSDICKHGLSTVLNTHRGSIRSLMKEAGFTVVKKKPPKYWNEKENRIKAVKSFIELTGKAPEQITRDDFTKAGLQSLLLKYRDHLACEYEKGEIITYNKGYLLKYDTAVERALVEAGYLKGS